MTLRERMIQQMKGGWYLDSYWRQSSQYRNRDHRVNEWEDYVDYIREFSDEDLLDRFTYLIQNEHDYYSRSG